MRAINKQAGSKARGALPKAATPAGNDKTPAPIMDLTKLNTSLGMVAVPSLSFLVVVVAVAPARRGMVAPCFGEIVLDRSW
mmetsp:Transcript_30905/g.64502  ORF Transcript_30905/g.64502 Transcript_30905/m.64502 type:complete len:81 (-) Transcript_30905:282-524(-)